MRESGVFSLELGGDVECEDIGEAPVRLFRTRGKR